MTKNSSKDGRNDIAEVTPDYDMAPADFWEERYSGPEPKWSGRVNTTLAEVAISLPPARALDLGCGEGGDVVWLAKQGWDALGIDISPSAIQRATKAAQAADLGRGKARFVAANLAEMPEGEFELVTASFLHSPVELPRAAIFREAAKRVVSGGHMLITSHAAPPPWATAFQQHDHQHEHNFLTPDEQVAQAGLGSDDWEMLLAEFRQRETTDPDGNPVTLEDTVVFAKRQ